MTNILVSICCTTFNQEKFIAYALDGFLMQKTNFAIEILINDDCSKDNTSDILKDYEKRFPDLLKVTYQIENQYSKGVRPFSQILLPKIKGKYVALCEGDDYWIDPYKLQKQVDFLEKNIDYSMCFHRCKIVDENNNELESLTFKHLEEKDYSGREILENWSIPTASVMFRAEYLDQIHIRSKTPGYLYGDTPLFLTLLENGKSRCFVDNMSAYRIHAGGISRAFNKKNVIALYKHSKTLKSDFNGKYSKVMSKIIGKQTFEEGMVFIKSGHFAIGLKFIILSVFYDRTVIIGKLFKNLTTSNK